MVDAELLVDEQAGHCISIRELDPESDRGSFGICVLDSATSEFNMSAFEDDACRTRLETMLRQLRPKELLYTKVQFLHQTSTCILIIIKGKFIGVYYAFIENSLARIMSLDWFTRSGRLWLQRYNDRTQETVSRR